MDQSIQFFDGIEAAWQRRAFFHDEPSLDCYRIYHGFSEGLAGVAVDRYANVAIINRKVELPCEEAALADLLCRLHPFERVVMKSHQKISVPRPERVKFLRGKPASEPLIVQENGWRFLADDQSLHTNGLYLDARSARQWIFSNSAGRRVLNLFAHTGSLGLVAALGGARDVVHLDKSRVVLQTIRENYALNNLVANERSLMHGDLYYHLPRAIKSGQKFSAIILDPPPRVPPPPRSPKHRPQGQDFEFLIRICCDLLEPEGWLLCIYHSHRRSHDEHDTFIHHASQGALQASWQGQSGNDFPEVDPNQKTRMTAFRFNV